MPSFDEMRDSIYAVGHDMSTKAKNASESARIRNLIKNNEKMIEKLTYQVGNQCVAAHLQDTNTEYEQTFAEIRRLQDENQNYQQEIDEMNGVKVCPQCGASNRTSAKFCIYCGALLPDENEQAAPAEGKRCPNCGTVNDSDAAFCVACGTALPAAEPEPEPVSEPEPEPAPEPEPEPEPASESEPTIDLRAVDQEDVDLDESAFETVELGPIEEEGPLTGKRCPNCGAVNDDESLFCIECGTPLPAAEPDAQSEEAESVYYCKNCGAPMTDDMIFCTNCGTRRE